MTSSAQMPNDDGTMDGEVRVFSGRYWTWCDPPGKWELDEDEVVLPPLDAEPSVDLAVEDEP